MNPNGKETKGEKTMKGKCLTPNEELWDEIPKEFLTEQNTWRLLNSQEKSLLTEGQLYSYERYWMSVVDEHVLRESSFKRGVEKGRAEGMEKGIAEGMEKGMEKGIAEVAKKMKQKGLTPELISEMTGLSTMEIGDL